MLNILIQETDQFFHHGLQCFFVEFFCVILSSRFISRRSLAVITSVPPILSFSRFVWEALVCFPELQARQKGIVIGLVEDEYHFSALPSCFNDIIFISRRASLDRISQVLFIAWYRAELAGTAGSKKAAQSVSIKYYHPSKNALWPIFTGDYR